MYSIINLGIDMILNVMLIVPIVLIWQRKREARHKWLMLLFACCLTEIFSVTGIPSIHNLNFDPSVNLMPFTAPSESPVQYLLNVFMFVPFGFIAPLVWTQFLRFKNILLFGFGISLFIETMQLFNFRATDIDDLIANTAGAVIGFIICRLMCRKVNTLTREEHYKQQREVWLLCGLIFAIGFTIQPVISGAIWSLTL